LGSFAVKAALQIQIIGLFNAFDRIPELNQPITTQLWAVKSRADFSAAHCEGILINDMPVNAGCAKKEIFGNCRCSGDCGIKMTGGELRLKGL
jgi:hypothetical protein